MGAISTLRPDDYVIAGYREHGHILAKGREPRRSWPSCSAAATAYARARAARCTCSTGASTSSAATRSWAATPHRRGRRLRHPVRGPAAGDPLLLRRRLGAEGEFHESMNLAALWKLPVVFICENNQYAMGTAIQRALAQTDISKFAAAYGMPGEAATAWTCWRSGSASGARWRAPGTSRRRPSSRRGRTGSGGTPCATPRRPCTAQRTRSRGEARDPIVGSAPAAPRGRTA